MAKVTEDLAAQGVLNANDLGIVSNDGYFGSFKLTLDQLYVCRKRKTRQVGYPNGVADQLMQGATLGICEADLPLQYRSNF